MVETTRPIFVSFASRITKEGKNGETGTLEVFTQIQDCPVTDEELLEIKKIQEEAAGKIDALFKRWKNPGESRSENEAEKKRVLTYKDGRPSYEDKEV